MSLLVTGLAVFIAIHLIPGAPRLRAALVERLGEKPYRGMFGAVALLSLVAVVWGFSRSPIEEVYAPPAWGHQASMILVPFALVLFAAANMPTRIRAAVRHPMLLGLLLWAFAHLLANGEVRSVVLFGGFALFAVVGIVSAVARGKGPPKEPVPRIAMDVAAVIGGFIVAGLLAGLHGTLFGVRTTTPRMRLTRLFNRPFFAPAIYATLQSLSERRKWHFRTLTMSGHERSRSPQLHIGK